eukprot:m.129508 g.129508  ORF g.129508 m.129508 type:complete len:263 (+) comp37981_c0_seq8:68-856(+)
MLCSFCLLLHLCCCFPHYRNNCSHHLRWYQNSCSGQTLDTIEYTVIFPKRLSAGSYFDLCWVILLVMEVMMRCSLQLAIDVQFPAVFGGLDGEAFYIDTEGGFIMERVAQIARAAQQHLRNVANTSKDADQMAAVSKLNLESFLSGIHFANCVNYTEVLAYVNLLRDYVQEHPKARQWGQTVHVYNVATDQISHHRQHRLSLSPRFRQLCDKNANTKRIGADAYRNSDKPPTGSSLNKSHDNSIESRPSDKHHLVHPPTSPW